MNGHAPNKTNPRREIFAHDGINRLCFKVVLRKTLMVGCCRAARAGPVHPICRGFGRIGQGFKQDGNWRVRGCCAFRRGFPRSSGVNCCMRKWTRTC